MNGYKNCKNYSRASYGFYFFKKKITNGLISKKLKGGFKTYLFPHGSIAQCG